jgi:hypothetical protein
VTVRVGSPGAPGWTIVGGCCAAATPSAAAQNTVMTENCTIERLSGWYSDAVMDACQVGRGTR